MMAPHLSLGARVRCATEPDWGVGQVQSIVGDRVTVTFEHAGKKVFLGAAAADTLDIALDDPALDPALDP